MANASLKSSASSSPKPLRASAPSIEISSSPKAQLSLSSGSPRSGAPASSEKQQGRLSPHPRSRGASPGRSSKPASATSSDRGLLEPSDQSSTSPSRRASLRSDDCSSQSDDLSRSTDGKSPRKASLAATTLEGRVFGEEKCFLVRDQWQAFATGVTIIETKSNQEMFRAVPLGDFDAELRNESTKDCRIHISFRTPSLLASIMTAKYRLRLGSSSGDQLASISESLSLSSKPKFSAEVKGAQVKLQGAFFEREFSISVNDMVAATISRSKCQFADAYQVTCAPLQDTWLLLALVLVVDRVRKENQRAASSSQSLAVSL